MVLEKTLESPLDCKEIEPVSLKEINSEYSLEGLMLKLNLQYLDHPMQRASSLEKTPMLGKIEGKRRKGMKWLDSITNSKDIKQTKGDSGGQRSLVCYSPWGHKELDMT